MSSPSEVIRKLILDLALGTDNADGADWPVFTSFLPDETDFAICVYDTEGRKDGRLMATGEQIEHPGIMVRVTGPLYEASRERADLIALALDRVQRTTVVISSEESYLIHNVSRTSPIMPLGVSEEGDRRRHNFTVNAVLTITTN